VTAAAFVVQVADLKRGPISASWNIPVAWLQDVLKDTEATPTGDGSLSVELTASGSEIMVRGTTSVTVTMPCARTLDPVSIALSPDIFLLLSPATPAEPWARGARRAAGGKHARRRRSADGPHRAGKRGRRGGSGWEEDPLLPNELAAQDTYRGEEVVLDAFVREFILLDLPMNPHRSDLPLAEDAGIAPPSDEVSGAQQPVDPRLAPLAAIASRLRENKE
jgi:uncharacterized metal-binding protein YceD (DUF177 family)